MCSIELVPWAGIEPATTALTEHLEHCCRRCTTAFYYALYPTELSGDIGLDILHFLCYDIYCISVRFCHNAKKIKVKHGVDGGSRTHRTQGLSLLYMPILLHPHISVRDEKKERKVLERVYCERRFPDGWCKRRDSNPYANAADSKSAMSAYSITLARFNFKHRTFIL